MHYEFDDLPIRLHDGGEVMFEISGVCGIDIGVTRDIEQWSAWGISVGYDRQLTHLENGVRDNREFARLFCQLIEQALERERGADIIEKLAAYHGIYEDPKAEHGHFQKELV